MSDELYRMLTTGEKPGFSGKDKMRTNAERAFGDELRKTDMHVPASLSAPSNSRMRVYKKGGHVNHGEYHSRSKHHGLNHDQADLHIPHRKAAKVSRQPKMSKVEHKSFGGMLGNGLNMAQGMMGRTPAGMALGMGRGMLGFKKGGKAQSKKNHGHKKDHYADGGLMEQMSNSRVINRPAVQPGYGGIKRPAVQPGYGGMNRTAVQPEYRGFGMQRLAVDPEYRGMINRAMQPMMNQMRNIGGLGGSMTKPAILQARAPGAPLKRGGSTRKKHHYATGGAIDDNQNMNAVRPSQSLKVNPALKRGGKVNHKRHRVEHHMDGGLIGGARNLVDRGFGSARNLLDRGQGAAQGIIARGQNIGRNLLDRGISQGGNLLNQGINSARGFLGFKHGGSTHRKSRMSQGGPMRGEHPSHHLTRNNYESDMKGEKCVRKSYANGGMARYADGGMMRFAKGGDAACRSIEMAAGGVGKMRHGVANKRGQQIISSRVRRGKD